jgi:hypothetical protein
MDIELGLPHLRKGHWEEGAENNILELQGKKVVGNSTIPYEEDLSYLFFAPNVYY